MRWRFTLDHDTEGTLVLTDEPIGWTDIAVNIKRDMKWHGVFFEHIVSLRFYGEGYAYIRNIYQTYGIDSYIEILIEERCSEGDIFAEFYTGKILLGKCDFVTEDVCTVSVPIDPAGCLMKFKNRIDQKVDLLANEDFDGAALPEYNNLPFTLSLEPKMIVLRSLADGHEEAGDAEVLGEYTSAPQSIANGTGTVTITEFAYMNLPIRDITVNELSLIETAPVIGDITILSPIMNPVPYTGSYTWHIRNAQLAMSFVDVTAAGSTCGSPSDAFEHLEITFFLTVNGTPAYSSVIYSDTSCTSPQHRVLNLTNMTHDFTIPLSAGDVVRSFFQFKMQGTYHRNLVLDQNIFFIINDVDTISPATYVPVIVSDTTVRNEILALATPCKAFAINEALSRTVEAITNDCMRVKSEYFGRTDSEPYESAADGCGSLEVITKGLLIRQFPETDIVFAVSFQDLFDGLNPIHNIGIGVEPDTDRGAGFERIRVEDVAYFYDSTILLSCDKVPSIQKKVIAEWYPSTINVGYEKWEAENSMGLDEFCTKREYRTTLSEVKNNIGLLSKFIASGYSIEVTRNIEFVLDSTKDWRYDNDIFIICVRRELGNLVVEQGVSCADTANMTDIVDPSTIYNYRISPVRNLMRWTKSLMGAYFHDINSANAKFVFTDGDGNFLVSGELINGCIQEGSIISENEDISIADFNDPTEAEPLFLNELDEFEYPLSLSDYNTIKANPRGIIQYRNKATDPWGEGYIYSLQYKPNEGKATFTLLPKY